jgi:hypothetical protein
MLRPNFELENLLRQLIAEHRKLLFYVEQQQAAMKLFDLKAMEAAARQQEAARLRIATIENKRRAVVEAIAMRLGLTGPVTITRLASHDAQRREALLQLATELKEIIHQIAQRTHVAGRLSGAVVGHLNTVMRLLAGAVAQAGVYTKQGVPRVARRIGAMEAVG